MAATSWITDEMRSAVGRELNRATSYPIAASDIRRWAIAAYYPDEPPPLFWDETHAAASAHGGVIAPEEFNPFAWMAVDPPGRPRTDGGIAYERQLGLAPVETTYMLNGGTSVVYGVPMRPGDVIVSSTTLSDYGEREGRLGLMLFTRTTAVWTNQLDEQVKSLVSTLIRY